MGLSILVDEHVEGKEVPGVEIPSATEPDNRDLELIGHAYYILVALLSESCAIGKQHIEFNKDFCDSAFHQVGHILISAGDILADIIFGKLIMIGVQVDSFGASFS